jgi:hypothetical protein
VAIDQVVETPSGDFAVARGVLERVLGGPGREWDRGSDNTIDGGTPPPDFFNTIGELELIAEVRTEPPSFGDKNSLSTSLSWSAGLHA